MANSTADQIAEVIREFPFRNFGMDDVDPRSEYAEWVPKLAARIAACVGRGDSGDAAVIPPSRSESASPPVEVHGEARHDSEVVTRPQGWTEGR